MAQWLFWSMTDSLSSEATPGPVVSLDLKDYCKEIRARGLSEYRDARKIVRPVIFVLALKINFKRF